jgi:hypothetical protein
VFCSVTVCPSASSWVIRRLAVRSGSAGLQDTLREAAELRAAHEDAIELALVSAVPNGISRLVLSMPIATDSG